jgi:AmmeMemoRadiSam system protein A
MSYNPDILNFKREIFDREHSLELEIPFLQFALDNDFKLLPISFAQQGMAVVETLINALVTSDINWDRTIIVLSTDMSHYHSYEEAMKIDNKTLDYVLKNDIEGLEKWMMSGKDAFCGWGPVITGMAVSESLGWDKPILLRYANSGDTSPESKSRGVVGYCSVVFVRNGNYKMSSKSDGDEYSLTHDQKKYLLKLARKTIEEYIINGRKYEPPKPSESKLIEDTPVFVTLHRKGMLRGCIGQMIAQEPLYLAVRNMAISAATRDPRFSPVPSKQLNEVDIEISVLSPMIKVNSYEDVVPNKHGIYIKRGYRTGVFLPQVWEHFNNRDGFLSELCSQKAMLERDCYKKSETEIYVFTVLEFDEKQYGLK